MMEYLYHENELSELNKTKCGEFGKIPRQNKELNAEGAAAAAAAAEENRKRKWTSYLNFNTIVKHFHSIWIQLLS